MTANHAVSVSNLVPDQLANKKFVSILNLIGVLSYTAKSSIMRPASSNTATDPVCSLPQEIGPCKASTSRWSYNSSLGECVEFLYGGCLGNANNFYTKSACEAKCATGEQTE